MMIDKNTTVQELSDEIICEPGLLALVDEQKLLREEYTREELFAIVTNWIKEGDESVDF